MKFVITYLDSTDALRTIKSEDVPAKIAKLIEANISLIEMVEETTTTVINTGGLTEEDAAKINMYDALIEAGVDNWDGWQIAVDTYNSMIADEPDDDTSTSEAA